MPTSVSVLPEAVRVKPLWEKVRVLELDWMVVAPSLVFKAPTGSQTEPLYTLYVEVSVLKTIKPAAGEDMASLWAWVILGARKPLVVETRSRMAEASGEVVPMPMMPLATVNEVEATLTGSLKSKRL